MTRNTLLVALLASVGFMVVRSCEETKTLNVDGRRDKSLLL